MTNKEPAASKSTTKEIRRDEFIVSSYGKVVSTFPRILSGLATSIALVYALGWLRAMGYFSSLSVEWLLPEVKPSQLISFGLFPILTLAIGLLLSFTDIAQRLEGAELRLVLRLLNLSLLTGLGIVTYFEFSNEYQKAVRLELAPLL